MSVRAPMDVLPAGTELQPRVEADLDEVMRVELRQYPFPWTRGNFADSIAAGYLAHVLRDVHGALLGYAVLMLALDEAHLLNITVAPERVRCGLGWALLDRMAQAARDAGARTMFLEVRPSNHDALRLYRRYGFESVGMRRDYYPAHEGREDALVMRVSL